MIPLQVTSAGPGEQVPGERVKIYVSFESEAELARGVQTSYKIGGVWFLGVGTEPQSKRMFGVFESENDASRLMADIIKQGVRVLSVVVKGQNYVRGLAPVVVQCDACGASMLYETHFSKTGTQYCDACLRKLIEKPDEKEPT